MGWLPVLDVPAAEIPPNAAREQCLALMEANGEVPADANNAAVMAGVCEYLWLAKAAIEGGLPDITPDSAMRGLEGLGSSAPSLLSFTNTFGPGRHDGAGTYRTTAYDPACTCFHYTSEPIAAG